MARIMGIDASMSCTGVAIYDTDKKKFVKVTKIHSPKRAATPTSARRRELVCTKLNMLMWKYAVTDVLIEDIFVNTRAKTSSIIPLAALRGAIEQLVYDMEYQGLHVIETCRVKKAVTGNGQSKKLAVYDTLKAIYKKDPEVINALGDELLSVDNKQKNEDMSDAVAVVHSFLHDPQLFHFA